MKAFGLLVLVACAGCGPRLALEGGSEKSVDARQVSGKEAYAYRSPAFTIFVDDSYKETQVGKLMSFYAWFERAYAEHYNGEKLGDAIEARKKELQSIEDPSEKAAKEREIGAWLHKLIKTTILKFSLDRGFEFSSAVRTNERQCLLQSVLISGLAQSMGIDAGVYMVWKNDKGSESNNGHCVSVFKLPTGQDILVDASDPEPFMKHQGLFVVDPSTHEYLFAKPTYDASASITAYASADGSKSLKPSKVRGLDTAYLRSQFYYYRGERAPGGFMGSPTTPAGLAASAKLLEQAEKICPQNSLAVYVLGHVYRKQGLKDKAKTQYEKGYALYKAFGYVPQGPREAVGL